MTRLVTLLVLWMGASRPAHCSDLDHRWGLMQGLMAGITVAHGVQPLAVAFGDLQWRSKHVVAISGTALYGTALVGHLYRQRWSLYIAIVGPAVGLSSILGITLLDATGVTDLGVRPDSFQVAGGLLQLPAAVVAFGMLKDTKVALAPRPGGAVLVARW